MSNIKVDRIDNAIDYLKGKGVVHTQKDVAEAIGTDKSSLSRALNGDDKYLTERFITRFNRAFGNIFNIDYLLGRAEEMFCPPLSGKPEAEIDREVFSRPSTDKGESRDEVIELLRKTIADKDEEIRFLRSLLQKRED